MSIYEVIHAVARPDYDDLDAMTIEVFDKIGCPQEWRDWFHPLVRNEVQSQSRRFIRERALTSVVPLPDRSGAVTRPAFLRDTIETFGEWGRVPFGQMTVEMHKSRIAGQLKLAGGIQHDIDKHADAATRIKAADVSCLDDLPEYGGGPGRAA